MPFKRKGVWYTDIRPRGADGKPLLDASGRPVRIRKRIPHVKYKPEAEKAERKMADRLLHGEPEGGEQGESKRVPFFEDFVHEKYLPWARENKRDYAHDEFRAEVLCQSPQFKGRRLDEFSVIQFENFKRERKGTQTRYKRARSLATINAELVVAKSIFRRAVVERVIQHNPTKDLKLFDIAPFRTRRLEPAEERRLFLALPQFPSYIEAVSIIALNTGMRAGEIARLAVEDIDFVRNRLFVRDAKWKGDKRQSEGLPLNATVRALLWKLCRGKRSGRLFHNQRGGALSRDNISSLFRTVCKKAKVTGFRFHDLRHEFGSRLGDRNVSPYTIARLMGHADVKMSLHYVHPPENTLTGAVAEVDSRSFGHNTDTRRGARPRSAAPKELKTNRM